MTFFILDPISVAVVVAWVDGGSDRRKGEGLKFQRGRRLTRCSEQCPSISVLSRSLSVARQKDQFNPRVDIHLFNERTLVVVGVNQQKEAGGMYLYCAAAQ